MGGRFFNRDGLIGDGPIRFITCDLGTTSKRGCRWDLYNHEDEWIKDRIFIGMG